MQYLLPVVGLLLFSASSLFAVSFVAPPSITKISPTSWKIAFTVDQAADVAVSIVNIADSSVLRHLGAGVLGANAPAPFTKSSNSQSLDWNGRDDLGNPVSVPDANIRVRVRAGMSLQLQSLIGDNAYAFSPVRDLAGIVVDAQGNVYVCGFPGRMTQSHWFADTRYIRKFDKNGNYIQSIYPFPSNLTLDQARGWGIYEYPNGSYIPKFTNTSMPVLSRTTLAGDIQQTYQPTLQMVDANGQLVFGSYELFRLNTDGSVAISGHTKPLLKTPAPPRPYGNIYAMPIVTPFPGATKVLVSGIFTYRGTTSALDTGFYRDGQVFIADPATGEVKSWLALPIDSIPLQLAGDRQTILGGDKYTATLMGTAVDSNGRVYVCDRLHKRIGVYDTGANYLGSIPVPNADRVAVSRRTGSVYVVSKAKVGGVKLHKFASFASGGAKVCEVAIATGMMSTSNFPGNMSLAVNDIDATPTVWVGACFATVRAYQDAGDRFTLLKDFLEESKGANSANFTGPNQTFGRVAVNRKTETVYINDDWGSLFKIESWDNPVLTVCSTSARKQLFAADMALSPDYRHLYVLENSSAAYTQYHQPIKRYTTDHIHAPANWSNTGSNMLTPEVYARYSPCSGVRGLAVATDGRVAAIQRVFGVPPQPGAIYCGSVYADSGCKDTSLGRVQAAPIPQVCGGVKYDLQNNLYLGARIRTPQFVIPFPWITGTAIDTGFKHSTGSIVRFSGTDSGSISETAAPNASKVYTIPLGPFSNDPYSGGAGCVCRSPRFEVDPYGRIFSPGGITGKVTIADNEGNKILEFGEYGNNDSRGILPAKYPGQKTVYSTGIPLCFPVAIAASEDYVYVCDYMNSRIVRARMNYAADNLPDLTSHLGTKAETAAWAAPLFTLSSDPVPFNRNSVVRVNLPVNSRIRLEVFDASGRCVQRIAGMNGVRGLNRFVWNGRDSNGKRLSAGLYMYRLTAGKRILTSKTLLTK